MECCHHYRQGNAYSEKDEYSRTPYCGPFTKGCKFILKIFFILEIPKNLGGREKFKE